MNNILMNKAVFIMNGKTHEIGIGMGMGSRGSFREEQRGDLRLAQKF
jgi:hypothetical protein